MAHAKLSPSGAKRWMFCPGSAGMEEGCADSTSEYADEGTAAHALAAMCLTEGADATAFLGRRLTVINGAYWPGQPAKVPPLLKGHPSEVVNHFDVDEDMAAPVQVYIDNIKQYVGGVNDLFVEQRLPIGHITNEEGAEGTGDAIILADEGAELQLHDLKFGCGVAVSPDTNEQLMLYALGALQLASVLGYQPVRVRLVIHQPRIITAPQEWTCTVVQLAEFEKKVRVAAAKALPWVGSPVADIVARGNLHPSEDGCRWCKAKALCPALYQFVKDGVDCGFEALVTAPVVDSTIRADLLGEKLDAVDLIETWCSAVRAEVERRLLQGQPVPSPQGGYKLVQGKKGRRSWVDAMVAEQRMKAMRLKKEEMYDFKLISPTTAEKLLKDTPKRWAALQEHIGQSAGKAHVAPVSDPRPLLAVQSIDAMFVPIEAGTQQEMEALA